MSKNRRAAKLDKITAIDPVCADCGKLGKLVGGEAIYPHRPDLFAKSFYRCDCGAYVGCHPGTAIALGRPAGAETRQARSAAHAAFDPLWKAKASKFNIGFGKARGDGYKWLADQLGIPAEDCHIGWMDAETARRTAELCGAIRL